VERTTTYKKIRANAVTKVQSLTKKRQGANEAANKLLQQVRNASRRVEDADFLRVLRRWGFDHNRRRGNVTPLGQDFVESETFGLVRNRSTGKMVVSSKTKAYHGFVQLATQWLRDSLSNRFHFPVYVSLRN
jgi:hypothetical protein